MNTDPLLAAGFPPAGVVSNWQEWLHDEDEPLSAAVRRQTQTGRPCGSFTFVERLEGMVNRVLHLQKVGRRKKKKAPEAGSLF